MIKKTLLFKACKRSAGGGGAGAAGRCGEGSRESPTATQVLHDLEAAPNQPPPAQLSLASDPALLKYIINYVLKLLCLYSL